MEVILRDEIEGLGHRGQVVRVAAGYARNFLLPKRLAVPATAANKKLVEQERQAWLRKEAKLKSEAEDLAKLVNGVTLTFIQKAGDQDQLFGSVTSKDIADQLEKQNFSVDRRKVLLPEPIKSLGEYKVAVRLHREVTAEITVQVLSDSPRAASEPAAAAEPAPEAAAEPAAETAPEAAPEAAPESAAE